LPILTTIALIADMSVDYDQITEIGGTEITSEAASMVYTRYALAAELARGRRTLEIGCASGVGLGLIMAEADFAVGGDVFLPMLQTARRHYGGDLPLTQFSAVDLPFKNRSFDFVFFMEATYYVRDFGRALDEIGRVLDTDGILLFVNANPERPDFIRSPHSEHYHSAREFRALLEQRGYRVETAVAFSLETRSNGRGGTNLKRSLAGTARKVAETLHLVPKTLQGRARIKRLIFGKLKPLPLELPTGFAARETLKPLGDGRASDHKVIYVVAGRGPRTGRAALFPRGSIEV
jgi:SAM-dependent methyltransferase